MSDYYDKFGQPIEDVLDWGKLFEDWEYRRIGSTRLWHGARVSTVWLGLDHSFGDGPPLIFETMIFGGGFGELDMDRYSTFADAVAGHEQMVQRWKWRPFTVWGSILRYRWRKIVEVVHKYLTMRITFRWRKQSHDQETQ